MSDDVSVAAAILAAALVGKQGNDEDEAYRMWLRLRIKMQAAIDVAEATSSPAAAAAARPEREVAANGG